MASSASHRLRRAEPDPTAEFPPVTGRRGRHSAEPGLPRIWYIACGAVLAVIVASVFAFMVLDGDDPGTATAIASATPLDEGPPPVESDPAASPTPTSPVSASPSRPPQRAQNPAVLLGKLDSTLSALSSSRQMDRNAAKELARDLRDAEAAWADGDVASTRDGLDEFANALTRLRGDDRITAAASQSLAAILTQLRQALAPRG